MSTDSNIFKRAAGRLARLSVYEVTALMGVLCFVAIVIAVAGMESFERRQASAQVYFTQSLLGEMLEEIQEVADAPAHAGRKMGIGAVCDRYDGRKFFPAELPGARILVKCYRNEATVPESLGGPQDLNLDGDVIDDFSPRTSGTKLRVVPIELNLYYLDRGTEHHSVLRRVIKPRS